MIKEIETRRSIRKYVDKDISKEDVEKLLRAAMHAPTALNRQEWRFYATNDRKVLDEIADIPAYKMVKGAHACIVVTFDKNVTEFEFGMEDAGAAIQNVLLEAKSMGIGTCWCAITPREERVTAIKEYLKLDDNLVPVAVISIGYPGEDKDVDDRYDTNKITWL